MRDDEGRFAARSGSVGVKALGGRKRGVIRRCRLIEELPGDRGRFSCPEGHTFDRAIIDRRKGQGRFIKPGSAAVKMMAHWFRSGVTVECPVCTAKAS